MKTCPLCGGAMQDTEEFCTSCGNPHEAHEATIPAAQPPQIAFVATQQQETPPSATAQAQAEFDASLSTDRPAAPQLVQPNAQMPRAAEAEAFRQQSTVRPLYNAQSAYGQAPQPNPYMPPPQQSSMYRPAPMQAYDQSETVSLGEWMLNYLIMIVPIVNIIVLCVWGFGNSAKLSVRNWARASLIWMCIGVVLAVFFSVVFGIMLSNYLQYNYYGY